MKVDTSKINGFEEMSAEEKLNAVLEYEIDVPNVDKLKEAISKANSEAAGFKKQLREKQSEEEIKAAQAAEEREELLRKVEELTKEKTIKQYESSYLTIGYDADMAKQNAEALYSGNFDVVFANQKDFIEAQKKVAVSAAFDKQPGLSNGSPITNEKKDVLADQLRKYAGVPNK
jgi:hypothetical protein